MEWSLLIYGTAAPPRPAHLQRARSAERRRENHLVGGYRGQSRPLGSFGFGLGSWWCCQGGVMPPPASVPPGPCHPECGDGGCEGPGPHHCATCLHFFLKLRNSSR